MPSANRSSAPSNCWRNCGKVNRAALSGETGQRGYLITLDRRYLAPYLTGREQIEPSLDRIRGLLGEDATPRQTELVDQIDALARAKFDEMSGSVQLLEDGRLLDARRAVLTDEGVETMERLGRAIAELGGHRERDSRRAHYRSGPLGGARSAVARRAAGAADPGHAGRCKACRSRRSRRGRGRAGGRRERSARPGRPARARAQPQGQEPLRGYSRDRSDERARQTRSEGSHRQHRPAHSRAADRA